MISATRYRKEAYVFAADNTGTQWDLRRYPRVVTGMSYADASTYITMGKGFLKLTSDQAWFTKEVASGTQAFWLRALARSSAHYEYNERFTGPTGRNALTSMPVQSRLWNYDPPPPN